MSKYMVVTIPSPKKFGVKQETHAPAKYLRVNSPLNGYKKTPAPFLSLILTFNNLIFPISHNQRMKSWNRLNV